MPTDIIKKKKKVQRYFFHDFLKMLLCVLTCLKMQGSIESEVFLVEKTKKLFLVEKTKNSA